jgi:hypothetical protein
MMGAVKYIQDCSREMVPMYMYVLPLFAMPNSLAFQVGTYPYQLSML